MIAREEGEPERGEEQRMRGERCDGIARRGSEMGMGTKVEFNKIGSCVKLMGMASKVNLVIREIKFNIVGGEGPT